jgi:hypothetical protein
MRKSIIVKVFRTYEVPIDRLPKRIISDEHTLYKDASEYAVKKLAEEISEGMPIITDNFSTTISHFDETPNKVYFKDYVIKKLSSSTNSIIKFLIAIEVCNKLYSVTAILYKPTNRIDYFWERNKPDNFEEVEHFLTAKLYEKGEY